MRLLVPMIAVLAACAAVAPSPASAASRPLTGRVLVSMDAAPPATARTAGAHAAAATAAASSAASGAGGQLAGPVVPQTGLVTVTPEAGETVAQLTARLRRDPRVRAVAPERRSVLRDVPNDPAFRVTAGAAHVPVEWWATAQNLPAAWDISHGSGARVAIVDTGVEASHPELAKRIVYARNFSGIGSARTDEDGHGTHVASLACAEANNRIGIAGAGYGCSIMVEKTDLTDAANIAAIVDAADHGADAINMSFGMDPDPVTGITPAPSQAVIDALRYARRKGAVLVAAAADRADIEDQGDPASILQPTGTAADPSQGLGLSVTASAYDGTRAVFGGRGSQISMAAVGVNDQPGAPRGLLGAFPRRTVNLEVLQLGPDDSTDKDDLPPCRCRTKFRGDTRYAYLAGTSMAAPQVAAIAALMRHLNPALPPAAVERMLKDTATRPAGAGWGPETGWGVLNGGRALAAARDADRTPPVGSVTLVRRTAEGVIVEAGGRDVGPRGVRSSGVAQVEVYRVGPNGPRTLLRTVRPGEDVAVPVPAGSRVSLTARAIDRAGNVQSLRSSARLRVAR